VGRYWYQSTGIALVMGCWTFFFDFKWTPSWILQKLEPKLLVMLGRIEALHIVYEVLHTV
jgi:hypothetical protein